MHWTRDAAIVAMELTADLFPGSLPLIDYVRFAQICQNSAIGIGHLDRASFFIDGTARDWSDQADGPALQTLTILQLFPRLDAPAQAVANAVIAANLNFLQSAYHGETFSLWEEEYGASFFVRSVQLKCLQAITANNLGIGVPGWLATAIPWLQNALQSHWNGQYYRSLLPAPTDKVPTIPTSPSLWRRSTVPSQSTTPSSWPPPLSCAANGLTRLRCTSTRSTRPIGSAASDPCSGGIRRTFTYTFMPAFRS